MPARWFDVLFAPRGNILVVPLLRLDFSVEDIDRQFLAVSISSSV